MTMTIAADTTTSACDELEVIAADAPIIHIGLVESDSSYTPAIFTGLDWYSVAHRVAHLLAESFGWCDWENGEPTPLTKDICDDYAALMEWLYEFHQQCTVPYATFTGGRVGAVFGDY